MATRATAGRAAAPDAAAAAIGYAAELLAASGGFAEMLRGAHSEACAAMLREAGR